MHVIVIWKNQHFFLLPKYYNFFNFHQFQYGKNEILNFND